MIIRTTEEGSITIHHHDFFLSPSNFILSTNKINIIINLNNYIKQPFCVYYKYNKNDK